MDEEIINNTREAWSLAVKPWDNAKGCRCCLTEHAIGLCSMHLDLAAEAKAVLFPNGKVDCEYRDDKWYAANLDKATELRRKYSFLYEG